MDTRLLVVVLVLSLVSACVGVACLIRMDQLEHLVRFMHRPGGRPSRLMGRGKVVHWPGSQPRRPR